MEFNYKKYSLEQLDNWMHDAMSSADASPGEIYNCIANAVKENYYYYKDQTRRSYDLLVLLNNDPLKEEAEAAAEIEQDMKNAEKFISYEEVVPALNEELECDLLPVEEAYDKDGNVIWNYINLPDRILQKMDASPGDTLKWIPQDDGTYLLKTMEN